MGILVNIADSIEQIFESDDKHYKRLGNSFEKYIMTKFDKKYFNITWYNSDTYDKSKGINVVSNTYPDIVIEYKPTGEKFAIECKYRTEASIKKNGNQIAFARKEQIQNYTKFQEKFHR